MTNLEFEIKAKDIAARIGKLTINEKEIETPTLMPVYNPNNPVITIDELKSEYDVKVIMTNAYIILKNEKLKEEILNKGIHKYLNFDGVVATDSGSYQMMVYGAVSTTNEEILKFQEEIRSDIGSFLDIPSLPDAYKPRAEEQLEITLERAAEAAKLKRELNFNLIVNAGVQGAKYTDLRKNASEGIKNLNFKLVAIGGIVKLMEDYRFSDLVNVIATVKENLPANKVVHAFGLGHPMVFGVAAALGCDLFDSAAYALYAKAGRYITPYGTKHLHELEYLPCSCPICSNYSISEFNEKLLAKHNLHACFEELRRVKQAITENNLWELIQVRARSHPALLSGIEQMVEHAKWLSKIDPITKKSAFFYAGHESGYRSEVVNAKNRLMRVKSENLNDIFPYGAVPSELADIYPFNSTMVPERLESEKFNFKIRDIYKIKGIMDYQFGSGAGDLINDTVRIVRSKKTRRIRWIYDGKNRRELIASVRARDHLLIPKMNLAKKLHEKFEYPELRVVIDDEAVPFVTDGKSVFCKFVKDIDQDLRCDDECLVVDEKDNLIRVGTLHLSPVEIMDFDRGMAVRVR
ncbi:MAG: tRNA-guanine(15) transglycosylase [Candidatus Altiarchaeales archaeon HGW-Altiarchaeales-3]|nr:MAG: tRNA-guanine(15) transglycosylase [Candidatus Altiarchaeales archaeon HGW-Altiarchaeales-3]